MAIITFWNNGMAETGQSMTLAGIATTLAINYNYKILTSVVSRMRGNLVCEQFVHITLASVTKCFRYLLK